jgi:hypothetical protein
VAADARELYCTELHRIQTLLPHVNHSAEDPLTESSEAGGGSNLGLTPASVRLRQKAFNKKKETFYSSESNTVL